MRAPVVNSQRRLQRILCIVLVAAASILWCMTAGYSSPADDLQKLERRIFRKVNKIRSEQKACALDWNEEVAAEARRHAQNMADLNFFAHKDPKRGELSLRLDASRIDWSRCAENLYRETGFQDPVENSIQSWMQSPGHRSNLLDPGFAETGIGAATSRSGTVYIVQIFIKKFVAVRTKPAV